MSNSEDIFDTYQRLSGLLREIADFMDECDIQTVRNYGEMNRAYVKEAYLLIRDCVRYTGLNTTKHIWAAEQEVVDDLDEDDI